MWKLQKNVWCLQRSMFLSKMFTNELTWLCHYEPKSKTQSLEWKYIDSLPKKNSVGCSQQRISCKQLSGSIRIVFRQKEATVNYFFTNSFDKIQLIYWMTLCIYIQRSFYIYIFIYRITVLYIYIYIYSDHSINKLNNKKLQISNIKD